MILVIPKTQITTFLPYGIYYLELIHVQNKNKLTYLTNKKLSGYIGNFQIFITFLMINITTLIENLNSRSSLNFSSMISSIYPYRFNIPFFFFTFLKHLNP